MYILDFETQYQYHGSALGQEAALSVRTFLTVTSFTLLAFSSCAVLLPGKTENDQSLVLALLAASASRSSSTGGCQVTWNGSRLDRTVRTAATSSQAVFDSVNDHYSVYWQLNNVLATDQWIISNFNYDTTTGTQPVPQAAATVAGCPANFDSNPSANVTIQAYQAGNPVATNRTITFSAAGSYMIAFYSGIYGNTTAPTVSAITLRKSP